MTVRDLKEILNQVDENIEVFILDKKAETWGIKNLGLGAYFTTRFYLSNFATLNSTK